MVKKPISRYCPFKALLCPQLYFFTTFIRFLLLFPCLLKVLSSQMDSAEIRVIHRSSEREARKVFRKLHPPPYSESPLKY
jgi:hypothetical protein